jgi:hypothetical protein
MEIRFYTANVIDPKSSNGKHIIEDAPLFEGASKPKEGLLGYHLPQVLAQALHRRTLAEADAQKKVIGFVEITISGLNQDIHESENLKFAASNMKSEELPYCDLLHLNRISAGLRNEIVEILKAKASTTEQRNELDNITADRFLAGYIKKYPESVDIIHEDERFKHLKVILFPSGNDSVTAYMVALYGAAPENIKIKEIQAVKGISFVMPDSVIIKDNKAEIASELSATAKRNM